MRYEQIDKQEKNVYRLSPEFWDKMIKLLRSQGMPEIFVALIASRISCALSAWGGFLTGQQINRINFFA